MSKSWYENELAGVKAALECENPYGDNYKNDFLGIWFCTYEADVISDDYLLKQTFIRDMNLTIDTVKVWDTISKQRTHSHKIVTAAFYSYSTVLRNYMLTIKSLSCTLNDWLYYSDQKIHNDVVLGYCVELAKLN